MTTTATKPAHSTRYVRIRTAVRLALYTPMILVGVGAFIHVLMTP